MRSKRSRALASVRAAFNCRSSSDTLQATGRCVTESSGVKSASCGPSYEYDESSGQCQQIFQDLQLPSSIDDELMKEDDDDED